MDDAFALLLSADRSAREQYLAARRIAVEAVDEARLELAQPEDERSLEDLLTPSEGPLPVIGAAEDAPVSGMEPALDAPDTQGTDPDNGRELPKEIELPAIDFDQLSILDAAAGSAADTEEGRRRADQRLGLGPSGSFDHEAAYRLRRTIGRRGEQAVFEAERRRMMGLGRDPGVVVWRSRDNEYAQYDIESQDEEGQLIYIEVKSTTSDDPSDPFEISEAELLLALQKRSRYYLYRVTSAHSALPQIERYQDPIGRLQQNTATLRLSGARLTFMRAAPTPTEEAI